MGLAGCDVRRIKAIRIDDERRPFPAIRLRPGFGGSFGLKSVTPALATVSVYERLARLA